MALTMKDVQKMLDDAFEPLETAVRKSRGELPTDTIWDDKKFSIAKYIRGARDGNWREADYEKARFEEVNKQLSGATGVGGGFLAIPEYSAELIELLRAQAVVRSTGARSYPMNGNTLYFNRITGSSTGYWVAEGALKTSSHGSFGQASLVLKEVAGLVLVTNDLLEDASPSVDAIIKQDLVAQLSLAEDLAFIQGTGGAQPLGVYNDPLIPTVTLGGGNGAVPTFDDLMNAMYAIEAANASYTGWLIHPRTKNTLRQLKDGNGQYLYHLGDLSKAEPDRLLGLPVFKSTQIPITLTFGLSAATCSYIILGDWREFAIGEKAGAGIVLDVSKERYFELDQTAIRAVRRVDCMVRQPNAFYIIRGVLP